MAIKTQLNFLAMLEEIYFDEIMVKKERERYSLINNLCIIILGLYHLLKMKCINYSVD
jgi:hypothetical protein